MKQTVALETYKVVCRLSDFIAHLAVLAFWAYPPNILFDHFNFLRRIAWQYAGNMIGFLAS